MTKKEWIEIITKRQQMYVNQLIRMLKQDTIKKNINFNSPTGTGKTMMIAMLVNQLANSNYFFLITTLSKGGLNKQVMFSLSKAIKTNNYIVYGVNSFTANTKLKSSEIMRNIPVCKELIWIRDEGHIKSNNWTEILERRAYKIVNVSATNNQVDIQCNFADTPLLRTPIQLFGSPEDSIKKLLEIKNIHKSVPHYNPCLIVRDVNECVTKDFFILAAKYNLKIINITDSDVNVQKLCENDNEFDIIINKMKITEGIDIPRANVLYIGNKPSNDSTTIQVIGRVRRNALLWNKDVDIFLPQNHELLTETMKTYVFYHIEGSGVKTNADNELLMELSDLISLEYLIPNSIEVINNRLQNGFKISELSLLHEKPFTGLLKLSHDGNFVTALNLPVLYQHKTKDIEKFGYEYKEIVQDKELVMISFDKTKFYRIGNNGLWRTTTTITDNIQYGKLVKFICYRYPKEISTALSTPIIIKEFKAEKSTENTKHINRCFAYLCKYYLKYLLFGQNFLCPFIDIAKKQFSEFEFVNENDIIFYAMGLYHRKEMTLFYGDLIGKTSPLLTINEILTTPNNLKMQIVELAMEMKVKVLSAINRNITQSDLRCPHFGNPNILHGMADLVFEDTLIQFSCKGTITKGDILKVLAYHYLSTKRYDLKIKTIFIFDFKVKNYLKIIISNENLSKLKFIPSKILTTNYFSKEAYQAFEPNKLQQFYSFYGENFTLSVLQSNAQKLQKKLSWNVKDKSGKVYRMHQSDLLKSVSLINNNNISKKILNILIPSKDTIEFAINQTNLPYLRSNVNEIQLPSTIINVAIKSNNLEIIGMILKKFNKLEISHLETAISTKNDAVIRLVLSKLNITKKIANDVIRTQCKEAIMKMLLKIKPTTYNFIVAIKTENINVVELIGKKCKTISHTCLVEAEKTNSLPIIDYIKRRIGAKL